MNTDAKHDQKDEGKSEAKSEAKSDGKSEAKSEAKSESKAKASRSITVRANGAVRRRAGFRFGPEPTEVEVTKEQFEAIKADPELSIVK